MSNNWVQDIADMHRKFGVNDAVRKMDADKLKAFLEFRIRFLQEELDELRNTNDPEEVTDALIDLCVVAIGTMDALDINAHIAWDEVHRANMSKQVGIKASRPNPLGLPDLIKPKGWIAPFHTGNIGLLEKLK